MSLFFSIVIPVFNGGALFEQCLRSVVAAVRVGDEIIVVADGESDGSWRVASKYGARVIQLAENGGPGRARNEGVKAAGRDHIFFVDADVTVRPDALQIIENSFLQEPKLVALIGSYDESPGQTNFLSQFKNLLHHYVHQSGSTRASTFWGACGAIRKDIFLAIGGFAEHYTRASIEDIELGYRLTSNGHLIHLVKELQITHHKRWTPYSLVTTEIFLRGKPWTRLLWGQLWRRGKVETDLNLDSSHRWSLLTSVGIVGAFIASCFDARFLFVGFGLAGFFLYLNRPVLRFFREKRGWRFAVAAAFWRFGYDLYSWVAFFFGSTDSARLALERLASFTFSEIDAVALGVAVGTVSGLVLFAASIILIGKGGEHVGATLSLLAYFLPGYRVTVAGALTGAGEMFIFGYLFGWIFGVVRNFSVRVAMGAEKVERATSRLLKNRRPSPDPEVTNRT